MKRLQGNVAVSPGRTAGTSVGFAAGCDNPSQLSFEYSRLHGLPPGKDAMRMRQSSMQDRMVLID